ncbi:hypothetical protein [Yoonia sp.]|uniref:hypothetical protein n=1 Tax=Yoonia sp. TaxID=2212373 RepID=UPI0039191232
MKYVQHVRKEWRLRITVPSELRAIVGCRELVARNLPQDMRSRKRVAAPIIERFLTQLDDARDALVAANSAVAPSTSMLAKQHYAKALSVDDAKRVAMPDASAIKSEQERIKLLIDTGKISNDRPIEAIT